MTNSISKLNARDYAPAMVCHYSDGWYVEYYVRNPFTLKMVRIRHRINRIRKRCVSYLDFKAEANEYIKYINRKLSNGWNPFTGESPTCLHFTPIKDMLNQFLILKEHENKPESLRSYKSISNMFLEWIDESHPDCKTAQLSRSMVVEYSNHLLLTRELKHATYNNHVKILRSIFSWAREMDYCEINPFDKMRSFKREPKKRKDIPNSVREQIVRYFEKNNPNFLMVYQLVFYSLVRPSEIQRIQIKHINLKDSVICLSENMTKTGYARQAILSPNQKRVLSEWINGLPKNYYLIGTNFKPSKSAISLKMYRKVWLKMRTELGLPEVYQLYSLRDSGICALFRANFDAAQVMRLADYHNLNVTTRYANHADPDIVEKVHNRASEW